jgi:alpha-amylase
MMTLNYSINYIIKHVIIVSLLLAGLTSCSTNQEEKVSKWPHAVNYEIFVRSFCDSDGDGIGDFNGMTSRLDHLSELGAEGIWLMPIHPSPSYHKYNVSDYYDVHPDYGTLDDFSKFVAEARKRNIKVVIDMVINHSGNDMAWFADAIEYGKESQFWNYYIWAHSDTLQSYIDKKVSKFPEYGRRNRWNNLRGTDYYYYSYFGRSMPQLNYDNPEVREEVFRIGRFWLNDIGVDGFRLDAARHVYPEDRPGDIHAWWEEYREEMVKAKEDVYLLGEVWAPAEEVAPYLKGLPALFNFDLSEAIQNAVKEEKAGSLVKDLIETLQYYQSVNPDFIDATFITNHDQNRIMSVVEGDQNKAGMAAALLFTLPGSPYVYYGEEIGMLGMKPDPNIREAFLWDTESRDECRTAWRAPSYSTDDTVIPLTSQKDDENSLYNFYREFIKLRNYSKALTYGDIKAVDHDSDQLIIFRREHERESLLVIHNISGSSAIFNLKNGYARYRKMKFEGKGYSRQNNKLEIPPYSTLILSR